jgi:hypothetical protein
MCSPLYVRWYVSTFYRRIGQFIFTKSADLQPSIAAGNYFPDVKSAELGELIGRSEWDGGRRETIQYIRGRNHKNSHFSGTIPGGGEEYNYNQWTFGVPYYYCVIRKVSERS